MATRLNSGRAGALAVVGSALCLVLATSPANAQCVGDCNGSNDVQINELILGVNIALGTANVSACPSFACQGGDTVPINCLIQAVNNALGACPPPVTTPTDTPTSVEGTPTETPTSVEGTPTETPTAGAETPTATPTETGGVPVCNLKAGTCMGGSNDGGDCTANTQCPNVCVSGTKVGQMCAADANCCPGTCTGGANDGQDCIAASGCPGGTCDNIGTCAGSCDKGTCDVTGNISKIELNVAALPVPLSFAISGTVALTAGAPGQDGKGTMMCNVIAFTPISIPSIGFVCISPSATICEAGIVDCDGGTPLSIDLLSDGNIGDCQGNDACTTACDTFCADRSSVRTDPTGCIGYCNAQGSTKTCTTDDDCLPKCSAKTCAGGSNDGLECADDTQCPRVCVGGANMGDPCTANADCPGSTCGSATCKNKTCAADTDCTAGTCGLPGDGSCNGPDPVGANANICQCQCLNAMSGETGAAGEFQCELGSKLVVEGAAPCDGTDVTIDVGDACIPITTATAESVITNANFNACNRKCTVKTCAGGTNDGLQCTDNSECPRACVGGANMGQACTANTDCPGSTCGSATCTNEGCTADADCMPNGGTCAPCTVPAAGPVMNTGAPLTCSAYSTGPFTSLKTVGVVNFFGSALGDIATELFAVCK